MNKKVQTKAILTCPYCGYGQGVEMPQTGCQYMYQCQKCGKIIKAKDSDCCVFCSYANIKCPPKQLEE